MLYFAILSYLALACVFALHVAVSHRERRDLYNRIMGGGTEGYMRLSADSAKTVETASRHRCAVEKFRKKGVDGK